MTACVDNKEKKGGAAKAVSATLAGVLAVGMVPAVAFATPADGSAEAEGDIELLAANDQTSVQDGTIAAFDGGLEDGASFVANTKGQGLEPTKVAPFGITSEDGWKDVKNFDIYKVVDKTADNAVEMTTNTIDGKNFYYEANAFNDGASNALRNTLPTEPGTYAVFASVEIEGQEYWVTEGATFTITEADLSDVEFYEVKADATDLSDTEFVFDATDWSAKGKLGLKLGDTVVTNSVAVEFYKGTVDETGAAVSDVTAAGTYTAIIKSNGGLFGEQQVKIQLDIQPYDLSAASITIAAQQKEASGATVPENADITIDGAAYDPTAGLTKYISVTTNKPIAKGEGTATFTPNATNLVADGLGESVINSKTAGYDVVDHIVRVSAKYNGEWFYTYSDNNALAVDFSATPTNEFDASKVAVTYNDPATGDEVSTTNYTLRVEDEDGVIGGVEMLSNKGTYKVSAVLNSEAFEYELAGQSNPMTVTVTKGNIETADIAFAYDDEIVTNLETGLIYTPGVNVLDKIDVTVKTKTGVTVPESDYAVVVEKVSATGAKTEVSEITDAGDYTITVKAPGYTVENEGTDNVLKVRVAQRDLSTVKVRVANTFNYTETTYDAAKDVYVTTPHRVLNYTGDVIVPSYQWSPNAKDANDDAATWYDLPAADYAAVYTQNGKKVDFKKVGTYTAELTAEAESVNYTGAQETWPEISDIKVFADVPTDYWGAPYIYTAAVNNYIKGYSGTSIYGPENAITRADAVIVLYNMAGGTVYYEGMENSVHDYQGYVADFDDVDKGAYYMAALSWAKKIGLVTGYDGTKNFAPNSEISREEFATMLYRYAGMTGHDTTVDDKAAELAKYPDGSLVAGFAQDAVAWMSQEEIMTGDKGISAGYMLPGLNVTRAQVAKMAVLLQPAVIQSGTIIG